MWLRAKHAVQLPILKSYVQKFLSNQSNAIEYLQVILENMKIQGESLVRHFTYHLSKISGVEQLKNLLQAIDELVWYLSPHSEKL